MEARLNYPATGRNRQPIVDALRSRLPANGLCLEIASGSGQHAVYFAESFADWQFQPSDTEPQALASIAAWRQHTGLSNLLAPLEIDASQGQFPVPDESVDVVFNANMIHIAPWAACLGLIAGANRCLRPAGQLIMYGPYRLEGAHTAPSNEAFDQDLQRRNPEWGVRDLGEVEQTANKAGLHLMERVPMPANNQLLFFHKS